MLGVLGVGQEGGAGGGGIAPPCLCLEPALLLRMNGFCCSEIGTVAALPVVLPDLDRICDLKEQRQWRIFCVKRLVFFLPPPGFAKTLVMHQRTVGLDSEP